MGQAIPYGIHELTTNHGHVCIGDCFDTPRLAVEVTGGWWVDEGRRRFPQAGRLLIPADAGGSNSCRYPTGCSKWNPIEHRLSSAIGVNRAGMPLRGFETVVRDTAGTVTAAGLRVTALLKRAGNETGERVPNGEMRRLRLTPHAVCPSWNHTLSPRPIRAEQ